MPFELNGKNLEMEIDMGAAVFLASEKTWSSKLSSLKTKVQNSEDPLVVVQGQGPSLFGRNLLQEVRAYRSTSIHIHAQKI